MVIKKSGAVFRIAPDFFDSQKARLLSHVKINEHVGLAAVCEARIGNQLYLGAFVLLVERRVKTVRSLQTESGDSYHRRRELFLKFGLSFAQQRAVENESMDVAAVVNAFRAVHDRAAHQHGFSDVVDNVRIGRHEYRRHFEFYRKRSRLDPGVAVARSN